MSGSWYFITDINPIPWTAPNISTARRSGKVVPMPYKSEELRAYQEAVGDALINTAEMHEGELRIEFFLWRCLEQDEMVESRRVRHKQVDATNLQKALEDACQGFLFKNDRDVRDVRTVIMEQSADTQPLIVIHIEPFTPVTNMELEQVLGRIAQAKHPSRWASNRHGAVDEPVPF